MRANTYFYLARARISLFLRVPFSPVYLYVNLRVPACLYVNIRGFGPHTRIRSFIQMTLFPVCRVFYLSHNRLYLQYVIYQSLFIIIWERENHLYSVFIVHSIKLSYLWNLSSIYSKMYLVATCTWMEINFTSNNSKNNLSRWNSQRENTDQIWYS